MLVIIQDGTTKFWGGPGLQVHRQVPPQVNFGPGSMLSGDPIKGFRVLGFLGFGIGFRVLGFGIGFWVLV